MYIRDPKQHGGPYALNRILSTIATAALCLPTGPVTGQFTDRDPPHPSTTRATGKLDSFIVQRMDTAGIMGLGAAIVVDKRLVWMRGYGFADKGRAVPFTPDTVNTAIFLELWKHAEALKNERRQVRQQ